MSWRNRLIKRKIIGTPVVEQTPFVWENRLYRLEVWQSHWDNPEDNNDRKHWLQIKDCETEEIISKTMKGFGLASAFVWRENVYVFASKCTKGNNNETVWNDIWMSRTSDLVNWSKPKMVLEQDSDEHIYNQSVCYDGQKFVMAYESDIGTPFTIRFAVSDDLENWTKLPDAVFGYDNYSACPAIRFVAGYYYLLYLAQPRAPEWWFETWLARSKNLYQWELAPHNPVIAPDPNMEIHPDCPDPEKIHPWIKTGRKEINASDPDLVEWNGKVYVYFTGGAQAWGGLLQLAVFDGTMQEFFEHYFEK